MTTRQPAIDKAPGWDAVKETTATTLVLFDFDGTITTRDTLIEFTRFYRGTLAYWAGMALLAPVLALYTLRLMPNWKAKQYFLARYFRGEPAELFNASGAKFAQTVVPSLVRPGAIEAIEQHRHNRATIAVVSASAENWVKPWCDAHGLICIATRLEVESGSITGNFLGKNCHGVEKVRRIKERFDLESFDHIIAYGDSSGDKDMLAIATESHYKPFRS